MNLAAPDEPVRPHRVRRRRGRADRRAGPDTASPRTRAADHQPGDTEDTWRIKASCYVGTIVTPDVRILITPKVATANLFYLLEASGRPLDIGPAVFDYEQTHDLVPSFATFYARHWKQHSPGASPAPTGKPRNASPGIRGRVDLPGQLRLAGLPLPAECRFDDYTADIPSTGSSAPQLSACCACPA